MTYRELLLQAELKLDHNDITLGEFEQMVAPLNGEVDVLDKLRSEIIYLEGGISSYHNDRPWVFKDEVLEIIDKYRNEVSK